MSSITKPFYIIRKLELNDCEEYRDILTELNLSAAKYINEVMTQVDPDSTYVAQHIETGKIIGFCAGYNHSSEFAFIGQYVVKPQFQGLGVGSAIWVKVMEHIGSERNISLYAANKMFQIYKDKCGFGFVPEKKLNFYSGKVNCEHLIKQLEGLSLIPINKDNIESVVEYDKQVCNGFDRSIFLEEYSKTPETISLVAIHEKTGRVMGYCVITTTNMNIATAEPLYADSEQIAELLIRNCCELLPISITNGLKFKCWDFNVKANDIANKLGLIFNDKTPILFTKQIIDGNPEKIYCVSNIGSYPF